MASKKITSANLEAVIDDMAIDKNGARTDIFYFSQSELYTDTIKQMAWKKSVLVTVENIDTYISKLTYLETLN
jgi:hypothetical protein